MRSELFRCGCSFQPELHCTLALASSQAIVRLQSSISRTPSVYLLEQIISQPPSPVSSNCSYDALQLRAQLLEHPEYRTQTYTAFHISSLSTVFHRTSEYLIIQAKPSTHRIHVCTQSQKRTPPRKTHPRPIPSHPISSTPRPRSPPHVKTRATQSRYLFPQVTPLAFAVHPSNPSRKAHHLPSYLPHQEHATNLGRARRTSPHHSTRRSRSAMMR